MCWLPLGLGLVAGIVGGVATYLAKGWGWGTFWVCLFGLGCGTAAWGATVAVLLTLGRDAAKGAGGRTPPA